MFDVSGFFYDVNLWQIETLGGIKTFIFFIMKDHNGLLPYCNNRNKFHLEITFVSSSKYIFYHLYRIAH